MRAKAAALLLAAALPLGAGCKRTQARPGPSTSTGAATTEATARAPVAATAAPALAPSGPLKVARTTAPIKTDGELNEPVWNAASLRTGPFVDTAGAEARPYSDGRFLWDDQNLYVALYAADDNIQASVTAHDGPVWIDDAFSLHITPDASSLDGGHPQTPGASANLGDARERPPTFAFDISAAGVVTDVKRVPGGKDEVSWESGIKVGVDRDGTLNDARDEDEEWVIEASIPLRALGLAPKAGTRFHVDVSRCDTPRRTREKRCGSFGSPKAPRLLELAP